jgi:hypothetical protein
MEERRWKREDGREKMEERRWNLNYTSSLISIPFSHE